MLKQAGLFVVSAGVLVYFIAPVDDEPAPAKPVAEKTEAPKKQPVDPDAEWESDDGDDDFVFGEPVAYSEESANSSWESEPEGRPEPAGKEKSYAGAAPRKIYTRSPQFKRSPGPNEYGGKNNPIDMSPADSRR